MFFIKLSISFLKALNEKASPRAMAGGFAFGMIIGLTPKGTLHNAAVVLLVFLLPVNKNASLVSAVVFALFSYLLDPFFNSVGEFLLTLPPLQEFWTVLYNTPIVPWTRFNNTLVLGSLVMSLIFFAPVFFMTAWGVAKYRERVVTVASQWKLFQLLKASKIYLLYKKLS